MTLQNLVDATTKILNSNLSDGEKQTAIVTLTETFKNQG